MKLPVDALLDDIRKAVASSPAVLVRAAAGSGKTTRIPPALLELFTGSVLVLEPRRIAARYAAERVAFERGERCGDVVGYQVRHEERSSAATRLKFITEGLLLRFLLGNPLLEGVDCVVLDEFHERSLHTDVAFALLRRLQATERPDLRLVIMSATLDAEKLLPLLPGAPSFENDGTLYPTAVEHLPRHDERPLPALVARAVGELLDDVRTPGHILVFLPGAAEIRSAAEALRAAAEARGAALMELRSELPFEEQARVFAQSSARKVILSTNIAETSVTIDGVTAVVDSGLARIAGFAHWSGLPTLDVRPVSQASCAQRAGRAGRTAPGVVKRLFTEGDFRRRPSFEKPEIARSDLSHALLDLSLVLQKAGNAPPRIEELPWLDPPPPAAVDAAMELLQLLGAVDGERRVTSLGARMASFPLHPRLSRLVAAGETSGCGPQALLAAAIISEGMIVRRGEVAPDVAESDVGFQRELFVALEKGGRLPHRLASLVDRGKASRVARLVKALCPILGARYGESLAPLSDDALAEMVLAGFPDRVCQARPRRSGGARSLLELNLCLGGGAVLSPCSVVQSSPFLVALEADERTLGADAATAVQIRAASAVSPEHLVLGGSAFVREEAAYRWDPQGERVRASYRVMYGALVLEERTPRLDEERCREVLAAALRQSWPKPFDDDEALQAYPGRCAVARRCGAGGEFPELVGEGFDRLLLHICEGKRSFAQVRERALEEYIEELLPPALRDALARLAPSRITVGNNRRAKVHYEQGKPPWVASRLQDFFGAAETPKIGRGAVPLVVHLLAPNGQAVQVTADLPGFWERVYPSVRKELCRRYPRHFWPEDPASAAPRPPGARRRA